MESLLGGLSVKFCRPADPPWFLAPFTCRRGCRGGRGSGGGVVLDDWALPTPRCVSSIR